jgi:serine phosphatase RsbU (regulator of sigma subunit)
MSDGITDAEREGRRLFEEWKGQQFKTFLQNTPTEKIVDELVRRNGKDWVHGGCGI